MSEHADTFRGMSCNVWEKRLYTVLLSRRVLMEAGAGQEASLPSPDTCSLSFLRGFIPLVGRSI